MLFQKKLGIALIVISVLLFSIWYTYIARSEAFLISQANIGPNGECQHTGPVCPYEQINKLAVPKYIGSFVIVLVFLSGLFFVLKKKPEDAAISKARAAARNIGHEEAKIIDLIINTNGLLFQNELVEKAQLSKVKVTRILDKLESQGLVERKRRGMTNIVVLK